MPTYTGELGSALQKEIEDLARRDRGAAESDRPGLRAAINYRLTAVELLIGAEDAGANGSIAFLAGARLARGRAALDTLVLAESRPDLRDALDRFNGAAVDLAAWVRTADPATIDAALAPMFEPIAGLVEATTGVAPSSHWPLASEVRVAGDGATVSARVALRGRIETLAVPAAVRASLRRIAGGPQRGLVERVVDASDVLQRADWLDGESAAAYRSWLGHAAAALERDGGERLARLEESTRIVAAIQERRDDGADTRSLATTLAMIDRPDGTVPPTRRATLEEIVDRMLVAHEADEQRPPRALRSVFGRLKRSCQKAERNLLGAIERLGTDPDALADPSFSSLVADHARWATSLDVLRQAGTWAAAAERVDPRAARGFMAHLKRRAVGLVDPSRAPATVRELSRFGAEAELLEPLAWETDLAAGRPAALVSTGGLHLELTDVVRATRQALVAAWAQGEVDSAAAARARGERRLLVAMGDCVGIVNTSRDPDLLNRWAAWEMPATVLRRSLADLPARLKLATAAAVRGDGAAMTEQLDKIDPDAPLAQLVNHLGRHLHDALARLPGGSAGVVGQMVIPPPADAQWIEQRAALAVLCRTAAEAETARRHERTDAADELQEHLSNQARELLRRMTRP
ncbi:MAG: hypothetical protein GY715_17825 [Planctomycetes bacterium]|nr:hypothetical protein [Planctomycetota bacterium]